MIQKSYKQTILQLKKAILNSRYNAATLVNKEMIVLYFSIGKLISIRTIEEKWGTKVLQQISEGLQKELPGLRGFSGTNLKKMKVFYEAWEHQFAISPLPTGELQLVEIKASAKLLAKKGTIGNEVSLIRPLVTGEFKKSFFSIAFTHHYEIVSKTKTFEEKLFYISVSAKEFWTVETLQNKIASNFFKKQGKLPNNFSKAIANEAQREKALQAFKDEYLLDFINIEDVDNADEKEFENEIVRNIRKFILSIGTDFAFMGNQYRLVVEEEESFVDLLFYNRKLQSLVAFELKKGKFKPEYMGKMNFYLSALDEMVKQPHENPSIGIILCKSKTDKIVEFSFRDFNKAMGVATYKASKDLPAKYKGILPDAKTLKKLL
jgi:predicted nuclease of restriction endonuclease-like (RecB) superfamily